MSILVQFQVMLDTVGPELQIENKTDHPITLEADTLVVLTPDQNKEASSNLLPLNFTGLSKVSVTFQCTLYFWGLQYYSVEYVCWALPIFVYSHYMHVILFAF